MMSSVIPARLQFQCGHAALVTLPRVKGESATQRNDRVASEKAAALSRQCDFCAQSVEVAVAINGNHYSTSEVLEAEPVAIDGLTVLVAAEPEEEPAVEIVEPVVAELELVVVEQPEQVDEVVVAVVETPFEETLELPVELVTAVTGDTEEAEPIRTARKRLARKAAVVRGRRFLVEYQVEHVLQAVDIRDALRQASAMGASQVTSITRED
jgi:hypothetical protein